MLKHLRFAGQFLWREWRSGEWSIVILALILAVSAVTSLAFFTDRLQRGLAQQAAELLGGNMVITTNHPIPNDWLKQAKANELRTAMVWLYPSVVSYGDKLQLVTVQAVSADYPLFGTQKQPNANTVWVEGRLLPLLNLQQGAPLQLGVKKLPISATISAPLEGLSSVWSIAPRLLMRLDDVAATKTVIAGSRVEYRLLLAGEKSQLAQFRAWITPQLTRSDRILTADQQQGFLRNLIGNVQQFLQLALLVCLLMSGVAIAISMQQYVKRHRKQIALCRALGMQARDLTLILLWQLILITLLAGGIGIAGGYLMQNVFANLVHDLLPILLPPVRTVALLLGWIVSGLILLLFAYPILTDLPRTSPLLLWRQESVKLTQQSRWYLIVFLALGTLAVFALLNFSLLSLYFIALVVFAIALLYGVSLAILAGLQQLKPATNGVVRRGISQLLQYPDHFSMQWIGFTLVVMALLILNWVRNDMLQQWRMALPKQTPNYFAFNIAPNDVPRLKALLARQQLTTVQFYAMARGRWTTLNGKPVLSAVPVSARGHNALHRELNLSAMTVLPADNKILDGSAWQASDATQPWISVEHELAQSAQLKIGDQLSFQVGSNTITGSIKNIRSVQWTSFHPNFYIIFPAAKLNGVPTTYITSFYLTPAQHGLLNQLVSEFPNVTIIDIANLVQQLGEILQQVTLAFEYLFYFALAAGGILLLASLQASLDERIETVKLLRILGATRQFIVRSCAIEVIIMVALICLSAFSLATLLTWAILRFFLAG